MGDLAKEPEIDDGPPVSSVSASPKVICEEFLKVLGRKEVEQPMIWFVRNPPPSRKDIWTSLTRFHQPQGLRVRPVLALPALPAAVVVVGH
jgi:hypothetical protein